MFVVRHATRDAVITRSHVRDVGVTFKERSVASADPAKSDRFRLLHAMVSTGENRELVTHRTRRSDAVKLAGLRMRRRDACLQGCAARILNLVSNFALGPLIVNPFGTT